MNPWAARTDLEKRTERRITVALLCAACIAGIGWWVGIVLFATPPELHEEVSLFAVSLWLTALCGLGVWKAFRG